MDMMDLFAVRRFAEELNVQIRQCDNGEGTACSDLETTIDYYVDLCKKLREYVNQWARTIFSGQIECDPEVESLLKAEVGSLLGRAEQVAVQGRVMNGACFELQGLNALHWYLADLAYLLENWVSPKVAVAPAARINLPEAAVHQIRERLEKLPPLPSNWRPTDPAQLAHFQKQRGQ